MDDASTVGGGLLGPLLAFIDAKKRGLLNDWNNPGQRLTQINEDARAFNRDQRYNSGAERSVIPEVADAARQQNVQQALNMGGLLGTKLLYQYAPQYRPPTATNMPQGIAGIEPASSAHKFGTVAYDRPLSSDELAKFELVPLDPKHPANIKKSWETFHNKFLDDFSRDGVYEVKGKGVVTESARPEAPFQFTYIKNGVPQGHEAFSDFDELSKFVWGMGAR